MVGWIEDDVVGPVGVVGSCGLVDWVVAGSFGAVVGEADSGKKIEAREPSLNAMLSEQVKKVGVVELTTMVTLKSLGLTDNKAWGIGEGWVTGYRSPELSHLRRT
ncbi:hypothetical protein Tco_1183802 [Tanacetum coccineum]